MRLKIICILLGTALAACGVSRLEAHPAYKTYERDSRQELPRQLDPRTLTRWIAVSRRDDGCPPVDGWKEERLMRRPERETGYGYRQPTAQEVEDDRLIDELGLNRFCVYTSPTPRSEGPRSRDLADAQPDRIALSASADQLEQKVWKNLAQHFAAQSGAVDLELKRDDPQVRLTLLDNQPDSSWPPAEPTTGSKHGYALLHLAHRLVCSQQNRCAAIVESRRALAYPDRTEPLRPLPAAGNGNLGTVSELADAIVNEIKAWHREGTPQHLILNLSVGWDGELFHEIDARSVAGLEPAVRAVYDALRFAAKRDVLVIAAAGNRKGGTIDSRWPLLPAAWEMRIPSVTRIARGRKLVYSVGGVDWQGLPLPNSRLRGHPQRVAYGDHAVVDRGDEQPTAVYTGSSVSTAVVSSIAAVVWHLRPDLRPDEVMQLIDRSGDPLETRADFYPWSWSKLARLWPAPQLRRASLCRAVDHACGPGAARCPDLDSAPECAPWDRKPPVLSPLAIAPPPTVFTPAGSPSVCRPSTVLLAKDPNAAALPYPCPTDQLASVASRRWVLPQPGDDPCPSCAIIPPPRAFVALSPNYYEKEPDEKIYALAIDIDPLWKGRIVSATLDIERFQNGVLTKRMTFPMPDPLTTGALWAISGLGDQESLWGCRAQLNFVVEDEQGNRLSLQNPVVVDP